MNKTLPLPSNYIDPGAVLSEALDQKLETLIVAGFHGDGTLFFSSSVPDAGDALMLLRRAELRLLGGGMTHDERQANAALAMFRSGRDTVQIAVFLGLLTVHGKLDEARAVDLLAHARVTAPPAATQKLRA